MVMNSKDHYSYWRMGVTAFVARDDENKMMMTNGTRMINTCDSSKRDVGGMCLSYRT
jgi:hypothetical protein